MWGGDCDKVPPYGVTLGNTLAGKKMLPDRASLAYIDVVNCLANNDAMICINLRICACSF